MSLVLPEGQSQQVAELNAVTIDSTVISPDLIQRFIFLGQVSERPNIFHLKQRGTNRRRLQMSVDREMRIFGHVREVTENAEKFTTNRINICMSHAL